MNTQPNYEDLIHQIHELKKELSQIKQTEKILQSNQNNPEPLLLATVVEQAEENVLITDNRRTIIYVNPAFERSSGYSCEEIKGKKLRTLRSDQHDDLFFHTTKDILNRGEVWMGTIINKGKDGTDFEIEGTISPIKDDSGTITHYVAVGRNMSRFRKLEKELQQAQKLDALGTLAGGIAHDFNNVLAAIMGFIEIEYLGADKGSQTHDRMEQALTACHRARDLIKQIISFSRQGQQRRKPVEIGSIVEDALKMLRATLPATIDIQIDLKADNPFILGDPSQIHQVIINLCTNAAHAMTKTGGILNITIENIDINPARASEYLGLHPGSYIKLTVSDTGHGMSRKILDRIFEPFYTTKGTGEGSGIGLAVVRGIVKNHGGIITARSKPGKGSSFQVLLPSIEPVAAQVEKKNMPFPVGNERILLVDDEEMIISVETAMLESLGYEVISVKSSFDALALFRSQHDRFQLVITDLTMPEMTGLELATEITRIKEGTPIILSTGFSGTEIQKKARSAGIVEVIEKPFVLKELANVVRLVLDQSSQSR